MNSANYELTIGPLAFGFPHLEILIVKKIQRMKKLLSLAAISSLFIASQASAISLYSDVDFINQKVTTSSAYNGDFNIVDNGGDSAADIFAIVAAVAGDGFNAASETVLSAVAFFTIWDDAWLDGQEKYSIDLGSELWSTGNAFFSFEVGEIGVTGIADLNADGILSYSVSATSGDFKLINAGLLATAESNNQGGGDPGTPVSDTGSTLALLGLGVLGLAGIRRKMAK